MRTRKSFEFFLKLEHDRCTARKNKMRKTKTGESRTNHNSDVIYYSFVPRITFIKLRELCVSRQRYGIIGELSATLHFSRLILATI